jgi:hypothetical protein
MMRGWVGGRQACGWGEDAAALAQEAGSNALRHGCATAVHLRMQACRVLSLCSTILNRQGKEGQEWWVDGRHPGCQMVFPYYAYHMW